MAMSFNFEISKTPNRLGMFAIYLRITESRKHKRIKTGIELRSLTDWNTKKQRVRASEPRSGKYNDILDKLYHEAKNAYTDIRATGAVTADKVVSHLSGKEKPKSVVKYIEDTAEQMGREGRVNTRYRYLLLLSYVKEFIHSKGRHNTDLSFSDITPAFLSEFEAYLRTKPNKHNTGSTLSDTTVWGVLCVLRTLIRKAIRIDRIIKPDSDAFIYYPIKGITNTKNKLTADEISKIERVEIIDEATDDVRNLFLFAFYCAGMRFGDCLFLRWSNITPDGRLTYTMMKTGREQDIQLVQQAKNILDLYRTEHTTPRDFVFPFIDGRQPYAKAMTEDERATLPPNVRAMLYERIKTVNRIANKRLKQIAYLAGIDKKITFHVARHSFARVAKQRGADNLMLKSLLAHSSLSTTERYMGSFDTAEKDFAISGIFDTSNVEREELIRAVKTLSPDEVLLLKKALDDITSVKKS